MKKLITSLLVSAMAIVANAASINWTITGSTTYVLNDYRGNAYSSTVYLISAADLDSITSTEQTKAAFSDALDDLTITTTSSSGGLKPSVSNLPVSDSRMSAGTAFTFGLLVVAEDQDGNGYYKVLKQNGTPYADGASADAQTRVSTAWNTLGTQSWIQGYSVQQEPVIPDDPSGVPEPATGALALAGVALLFKRRRA